MTTIEKQAYDYGRSAALKQIQEAQEAATYAINEVRFAKLENRPLRMSTGKVLGCLVYFYNIMKPYLKKYLPESFEEVRTFEDLINSPPQYRVEEGILTDRTIKISLFDTIGFEAINAYYSSLYNAYVEMGWGVPSPKKIDVCTYSNPEAVNEEDLGV
ncbi:hypothetical protein [Methanosalsum natronophilum]|uniref:hypothetical protein n=1 Tax=Methanosalsum natronophilum TaxID=768733 RepID=UPI002167C4C9|nr:hypothetical protein [Methanosalsum natronophilum]MCS3924101.1 hypothetical protein [Methanosalsum natronophilum]